MIACDGMAVWSDNKITLDGETPTEDEVKELVAFINRTSPGRICASAEIAKVYAAGEVVSRPRRRLPRHSDLAHPARLPDLLPPRSAALGQLGRRSQQGLRRRARTGRA